MPKYSTRNVGESQSVLMMINPMISPRMRMCPRTNAELCVG
eukprot:COSAG01_NODE_65010_length_274_cov_1.182857_1_plen_40_part_10